MLAPLLMVPAPCPLHLRPGGGAQVSLGRGRAGTGRDAQVRAAEGPRGRPPGWPRRRSPHACRAPSRPVPCRPGGQEAPSAVPWRGFPAPAVRRRRPQPGSRRRHLRVRAQPLRSTPAAAGVQGTRNTGAAARPAASPAPPQPPRPRAARPRPSAPPHLLGPAPRGSQGGAPPSSSQRVMTQDAVTPCLSHLPEVLGPREVFTPVPVFQPRSGCEAGLRPGKFFVARHQDGLGKRA